MLHADYQVQNWLMTCMQGARGRSMRQRCRAWRLRSAQRSAWSGWAAPRLHYRWHLHIALWQYILLRTAAKAELGSACTASSLARVSQLLLHEALPR
jgi:hypothetical protein